MGAANFCLTAAAAGAGGRSRQTRQAEQASLIKSGCTQWRAAQPEYAEKYANQKYGSALSSASDFMKDS